MSDIMDPIMKLLNSINKNESIDVVAEMERIDASFEQIKKDDETKIEFIKIYSAILVGLFAKPKYLPIIFGQNEQDSKDVISKTLIQAIKICPDTHIQIIIDCINTISIIIQNDHTKSLNFSTMATNFTNNITKEDVTTVVNNCIKNYAFSKKVLNLFLILFRKSLTTKRQVISLLLDSLYEIISHDINASFSNEITEILRFSSETIDGKIKNMLVKYSLMNITDAHNNNEFLDESSKLFKVFTERFFNLPLILIHSTVVDNVASALSILSFITDYYSLLNNTFTFSDKLIEIILNMPLKEDYMSNYCQTIHGFLSNKIISITDVKKLWDNHYATKDDKFYVLFKFLSISINENDALAFLDIINSDANKESEQWKDLLLSLSLSYIKRSFSDSIIQKTIENIFTFSDSEFYSHNVVKVLLENKRDDILHFILKNYTIAEDDTCLIFSHFDFSGEELLQKYIDKKQWVVVQYLIKEKQNEEIVKSIMEKDPSIDVVFQLVHTKSLSKDQLFEWIPKQEETPIISEIVNIFCQNNKNESFPFDGEDLLWKFAKKGYSHGHSLIKIYNESNDESIINIFLNKWKETYDSAENESEKQNLMRVLLKFVKLYDSYVIDVEKHLKGQERKVKIPIYGDFIPNNFNLTISESKRLIVVLDIIADTFNKPRNQLSLVSAETNEPMDMKLKLSYLNWPIKVVEIEEPKEISVLRQIPISKIIIQSEIRNNVFEMAEACCAYAQDLLYELPTLPEVIYKIRSLSHISNFNIHDLLPIKNPFVYIYVLDKLRSMNNEKIVPINYLIQTIEENIENADFIKVIVDFIPYAIDKDKISEKAPILFSILVKIYNKYQISPAKALNLLPKKFATNHNLSEEELTEFIKKSISNGEKDNIISAIPFSSIKSLISVDILDVLPKIEFTNEIFEIVNKSDEKLGLELYKIAMNQNLKPQIQINENILKMYENLVKPEKIEEEHKEIDDNKNVIEEIEAKYSNIANYLSENNNEVNKISEFVFSEKFYENVDELIEQKLVKENDSKFAEFVSKFVKNYPLHAKNIASKCLLVDKTPLIIDVLVSCAKNAKKLDYKSIMIENVDYNKVCMILNESRARDSESYFEKHIKEIDTEIRERIMTENMLNFNIIENYFNWIYFSTDDYKQTTIEYICKNYRAFIIEYLDSNIVKNSLEKLINLLELTEVKMEIADELVKLEDDKLIERGFKVCTGKCSDPSKLVILMQNATTNESFDSVADFFENYTDVIPYIYNNYDVDDEYKCKRYAKILMSKLNENSVSYLMFYATRFVSIFDMVYKTVFEEFPEFLFAQNAMQRILKFIDNPGEYYSTLAEFINNLSMQLDVNSLMYETLQKLKNDLEFFDNACENPLSHCFSDEEVNSLRCLLLLIKNIQMDVDQSIRDLCDNLRMKIVHKWAIIETPALMELCVVLQDCITSFSSENYIHPLDDYY